MSRAERAKEYFLQGYACSQAVALAFCDVTGVNEEMICKMMLPFGGGLGRLRLTCGAVSGMAAVIGTVFADAENTPENKKNTYAIVQELCGKFREETGSISSNAPQRMISAKVSAMIWVGLSFSFPFILLFFDTAYHPLIH